MSITLKSATPRDDDVLEVLGTDDEGKDVTALGWVSAVTNHYDASAYATDTDGNVTRDPNAKPREMTPDEVRTYCQAVLDATVATAAPPPHSTIQPINF